MTNFKNAIGWIVLLVSSYNFSGCHSKQDYNGYWERIVDDGEYAGVEAIDFEPHNIVLMGSKLKYSNKEDGFYYQIEFETSITGVRECRKSDILIELNISTFTFKEIPNSFHVYLTEHNSREYRGEYVVEMKETLKRELRNRFYNFYNQYREFPYELKDVRINNYQLRCKTDILLITFEKSMNKSWLTPQISETDGV